LCFSAQISEGFQPAKSRPKGEGTVKVLDVLRKLGIVRFGAKAAVYHNAKERPLEFMMDDVFNAEKDLVAQKSKSPDGPKGKRSVHGGSDSYLSTEFD
jgi:hypothetical protein